jgi:hypothetical protein
MRPVDRNRLLKVSRQSGWKVLVSSCRRRGKKKKALEGGCMRMSRVGRGGASFALLKAIGGPSCKDCNAASVWRFEEESEGGGG